MNTSTEENHGTVDIAPTFSNFVNCIDYYLSSTGVDITDISAPLVSFEKDMDALLCILMNSPIEFDYFQTTIQSRVSKLWKCNYSSWDNQIANFVDYLAKFEKCGWTNGKKILWSFLANFSDTLYIPSNLSSSNSYQSLIDLIARTFQNENLALEMITDIVSYTKRTDAFNFVCLNRNIIRILNKASNASQTRYKWLEPWFLYAISLSQLLGSSTWHYLEICEYFKNRNFTLDDFDLDIISSTMSSRVGKLVISSYKDRLPIQFICLEECIFTDEHVVNEYISHIKDRHADLEKIIVDAITDTTKQKQCLFIGRYMKKMYELGHRFDKNIEIELANYFLGMFLKPLPKLLHKIDYDVALEASSYFFGYDVLDRDGFKKLAKRFSVTQKRELVSHLVRPSDSFEKYCLTSLHRVAMVYFDKFSKTSTTLKKNLIKKPSMIIEYIHSAGCGRIPEAEKYIIKNPKYAVYYAVSVLKHRWLEAEPVIFGDKTILSDMDSYYRNLGENKKFDILEDYLYSVVTKRSSVLNKHKGIMGNYATHLKEASPTFEKIMFEACVKFKIFIPEIVGKYLKNAKKERWHEYEDIISDYLSTSLTMGAVHAKNTYMTAIKTLDVTEQDIAELMLKWS